jgi:hypothetical protein
MPLALSQRTRFPSSWKELQIRVQMAYRRTCFLGRRNLAASFLTTTRPLQGKRLAEARRIAVNIGKLPELLRKP